MRKIDIYGAGAVVWRKKNKKLEVLLVHQPRRKGWSFPKGKCKEGESLYSCCLREVWEEGRVAVALGISLGWRRYKTNGGRRKAVHYWTAQVLPVGSPVQNIRQQKRVAPKSEIDKVRWVAVESAEKMLRTALDRQLLAELRMLEKAGDLAAVPVIVLRHAKAMKREKWGSGEDAERNRPLTEAGEMQAVRVAEVLSAYGVMTAHSSAWQRCRDTVASYVEKTQIPLELREELTESSYRDSPATFSAAVDEFFLGATLPRVICLHRPTLPAVLEILTKYFAEAELGELPSADPWLKPAEMIIAQVVQKKKLPSRIVQVERELCRDKY